MRNKIFGAIGVLWGGAIILNKLLSDSGDAGTSAYQSGQSMAVVIGAVLLVAGLYYLFKK